MSLILKCFEKFMDITSGDVYLKDKKGIYLDVNAVFLRLSGTQSFDEVIGKTDRDLIWSAQASIMMDNDQKTIYSRQKKIAIEPAKSISGSIVHFLSHKSPMFSNSNSNKLIGIFGISFLLEGYDSLSLALNHTASLTDNPAIANEMKSNAYRAKGLANKLTKRQSDCLYYLAYGMTLKQIAANLNLSPKTVEHHLEAVKEKLNCYSRSDLVAKAFEMGLVVNNSYK